MAAPLIVPVLPGVLGAGEQRQVLEPIVERDRPAGERTTNYPPEDAA